MEMFTLENTFPLCFVICHKKLKRTILQETHWEEVQTDLRVEKNHANVEKVEEPIKYQK